MCQSGPVRHSCAQQKSGTSLLLTLQKIVADMARSELFPAFAASTIGRGWGELIVIVQFL